MRRAAIYRAALVLLTVAAAIMAARLVSPFLTGFSLVVRAADWHGPGRWLAEVGTVSVTERTLAPTIEGVVSRLRIYAPIAEPRQTVLLVTGVHPGGIDEPRLIRLARELARSNVTVVTPEIPELKQFEITPLVTDRIAAVAAWLAIDSRLARGRRVGMIGVSFSGGLAVVAAGRPQMSDRVQFVVSIGGHDDLQRLMDHWCRDSRDAPPHDYGLAVALLIVADRIVPTDQVEPLRAAVRRFLEASYLERQDKSRAEVEFLALRDLALTLPEPAALLLARVNERDVAHLGACLGPALEQSVVADGLSPARSPLPAAPVFLLHGADDTVIPSTESEHLAARLRLAHVPVRLLVTDLMSHGDVTRSFGVVDLWQLSAFWGEVLAF